MITERNLQTLFLSVSTFNASRSGTKLGEDTRNHKQQPTKCGRRRAKAGLQIRAQDSGNSRQPFSDITNVGRSA